MWSGSTDTRPRPNARRAHDPPGPRARYPGEFVVRLASDRLQLFSTMAQAGDVSRIRIGPQPVVQLLHPDDIRRVLVEEQRNFTKGRALERTESLLGKGLLTSEDPLHRRQRRLMQPAFHRDRIATYADVMTAHARRMAASWSHGRELDAHAEMMRLTLAIAGRALFDADVEGDAQDVAEVMELSLRMFNYTILPLGILLERAPLSWVRRLRRSRKRMDALIYRIIEQRRRSGAAHDDVMSLLMAAHDGEQDGRMTDRQLRDEVVTLLMAGHETTANWLTWTWYLLATNPEVERQLHEELDTVLRGRVPSFDDIPRLPMTRAILAESLRIYPPAWALERVAQTDFEAGGYVIRRGTIVIMCQYLVHRDPRWWPEPLRFDPARWTPAREWARPKFAYFPFGGGARMCIGEHFAWTEAMLVLTTLAQRFRVRYVGLGEPRPEALVTLRPRGGLRVCLEARAASCDAASTSRRCT